MEEAREGELAVACIACPRPGVNLPVDWADAAPEKKYVACFPAFSAWPTTHPSYRFLYMLFVAIDACFRLKRKDISSWELDPSLQDGQSYFVSAKPYAAWCETLKDQTDVSHLVYLSSERFF